MPPKSISEREIQRYWEIFATLSRGGTHLDGGQAASVLKDSGLSEDQLAKIWDLADVDNDGSLDFEEFCVAMRLIYDVVNGEYAAVPAALPEWLVPASKAHLVQAHQAIAGTDTSFERPDYSDDDTPGLKDGFDWYMPPSDAAKYTEIYRANCDAHGDVTFAALQPLYDSLDVPDSDVSRAWTLVNPRNAPTLGKDACLAFLHVLNNRHEGFRLPRTVPASLRASFERRTIDYQVERQQTASPRDRWATDHTGQGAKTRFGEAYLSRIGLGGGTNYSKGTDFSAAKDTPDWEEVRLKKQLAALTDSVERLERQATEKRGGRRADSTPALVKRELEQMLDYKRRELRDLEVGEGRAKEGQGLKQLREDVDGVREQVEGLERHWKEREGVLEGVRDEVAEEKAR